MRQFLILRHRVSLFETSIIFILFIFFFLRHIAGERHHSRTMMRRDPESLFFWDRVESLFLFFETQGFRDTESLFWDTESLFWDTVSFLRHRVSFLRHRVSFLRHRVSFLRHRVSFLRHRVSFLRHRARETHSRTMMRGDTGNEISWSTRRPIKGCLLPSREA